MPLPPLRVRGRAPLCTTIPPCPERATRFYRIALGLWTYGCERHYLEHRASADPADVRRIIARSEQ